MADVTSPYTFRIIRGRVVPIKITDRPERQALQYQRKKARYHETKQSKGARYAKSAATVAAGVGLVVGARFGAGRLSKYVATKIKPMAEFSNPRGVTFMDHVAEGFYRLRQKVFAQAKIVKKAKNVLNYGVVPVGATLAAAGIERAVETYKGKPLSNRERVAYLTGGAASAAGAGAFLYGYRTGQGRKIGKFFSKIGQGFGTK